MKNFHRTVQAGILTLCLAATSTYAKTHHDRVHRTDRDAQVVDVNAHVLPPPIPLSRRHVIVVNSAQHAPRRHGVVGTAQRLHKWHMRQRAKIYRHLVD
jgi:hypothetical protein